MKPTNEPDSRLLLEITPRNLLSFGPDTQPLALQNLNVLIGPNGSGKSNLLEMLALLRAAPTRLAAPVKGQGGIAEWLWKGPGSSQEGLLEAVVRSSEAGFSILHSLVIGEHGGRFEVVDEQIGKTPGFLGPESFEIEYFFQRGNPELHSSDAEIRRLRRDSIRPEESILSQIRDPERYPLLATLQAKYEEIRLFRDWAFGPAASVRREQSTYTRSDFLADGGENLPLVLSRLRPYIRAELLASIQELYAGIEDFYVDLNGGNAQLYLQEEGGRNIPASRLSDGTLRYLCLLAILLHPEPPPLIAIEEPELGLHPDIIPHVAKLLVSASERTQLIVTTHSDVLVDALTSQPEAVIVCEKGHGESQLRRLDAAQLKLWLEKYTLGQLWSMGEIGGNRW
jgi:predicted ATPase